MAGLAASRAWVSVGPPLSAEGSEFGIAHDRLIACLVEGCRGVAVANEVVALE